MACALRRVREARPLLRSHATGPKEGHRDAIGLGLGPREVAPSYLRIVDGDRDAANAEGNARTTLGHCLELLCSIGVPPRTSPRTTGG